MIEGWFYLKRRAQDEKQFGTIKVHGLRVEALGKSLAKEYNIRFYNTL